MRGDYLILACGSAIWCCLHSLLISRSVSSWIKTRLGKFRSCYRIFYNVAALITLLPLVIFVHTRPGDIVLSWSGAAIFRFMILLTALGVFYLGSRQYDLKTFLGLTQIRSGVDEKLLSGTQAFSREGIHGVVRHPWYLGSLLFLWSALPRYSQAACIAGAVFSIYLVVGAFLEERRLTAEFGESYKQYQREVSMFFPWKWLMMKFRGGADGAC